MKRLVSYITHEASTDHDTTEGTGSLVRIGINAAVSPNEWSPFSIRYRHIPNCVRLHPPIYLTSMALLLVLLFKFL